VLQLPAKASVVVCDYGFDHKTIQVQHRGGLYFMFRQDLLAGERMN
jgi:hypothetical protein